MAPTRTTALALLLVVAPVPALTDPSPPILTASLDAPAEVPVGAGLPVVVRIEWATPAVPPHHLVVHAGFASGDAAEDADVEREVAPTTGPVVVTLTLLPRHAGDRVLLVDVEATPGGHASATRDVRVVPDEVAVVTALEAPLERWQGNISITATPERLDGAAATVTVTARFGTEPAFRWDLLNATTTLPVSLRAPLLARHGPGLYDVRVAVGGPDLRPAVAALDVLVPDPPASTVVPVAFTVEDDPATITLTDEDVNADGKRKSPGEDLVTRARLDNFTTATRVEATVYRLAESPVPIAVDDLVPDAAGKVEHRWAHAPQAAGPYSVVLRVGTSTAQRTFEVLNRSGTMRVGPATADAWAAGAPVRATVTLLDPNYGSTPMDPGPVTGLPDLRYRLLRGTKEPGGDFAAGLGPWTFGTSGRAYTSTLAWPDPGLDREDEPGLGGVRLPFTLTMPPDAATGAYRVSLYVGTTRLGGLDIEVLPMPTLAVRPLDDPAAGAPYAFNATVTDAPTNATLVGRLEGATTAPVWANATVGDDVVFPLPPDLVGGSTLRVKIALAWPGGPPDGIARFHNVTLPGGQGTVLLTTTLDGTPVQNVMAHPASDHVLHVAVAASGPGQGPIDLAATSTDWNGTVVGWSVVPAMDGFDVHIPAGALSGLYSIRIEAGGDGWRGNASVPVLVAVVHRLVLSGALAGSGPPGVAVPLGTLAIFNAGNAPLRDVALRADDEALSLQLPTGGLPAILRPGDAVEVEVSGAAASGTPPGPRTADVTAWGRPA